MGKFWHIFKPIQKDIARVDKNIKIENTQNKSYQHGKNTLKKAIKK